LVCGWLTFAAQAGVNAQVPDGGRAMPDRAALVTRARFGSIDERGEAAEQLVALDGADQRAWLLLLAACQAQDDARGTRIVSAELDETMRAIEQLLAGTASGYLAMCAGGQVVLLGRIDSGTIKRNRPQWHIKFEPGDDLVQAPLGWFTVPSASSKEGRAHSVGDFLAQPADVRLSVGGEILQSLGECTVDGQFYSTIPMKVVGPPPGPLAIALSKLPYDPSKPRSPKILDYAEDGVTWLVTSVGRRLLVRFSQWSITSQACSSEGDGDGGILQSCGDYEYRGWFVGAGTSDHTAAGYNVVVWDDGGC
jgi:hypothetical protein